MKKAILFALSACCILISVASRNTGVSGNAYSDSYHETITRFKATQQSLLQAIRDNDLQTDAGKAAVTAAIHNARSDMKTMDFWMRYLEPTVYKKVNGPLPVEWETEVFEKFEKPYKRDGAGLTLAYLSLDEGQTDKAQLTALVDATVDAMHTYEADSITRNLATYDHFFLCNRLFLLNLAAIYTTGFECPETEQVIPELRQMLSGTGKIYDAFNESFPQTRLSPAYLELYGKTIDFVRTQPDDINRFDHYTFIRDYVNPLYKLNQQLILQYRVITRSLVDYALNKNSPSIFSKDIYDGQNAKGVFARMEDESDLAELSRLGKLLFFDPILSGNNERSCASCHKPETFFTDTAVRTALQFNGDGQLPRNTPSLVNAEFNHLVMLDGMHYNLQHQTKGVITNPNEMGGKEQEILEKVLSCKEYSKGFKKLLAYTPQQQEITMDHIVSAVTYYYSGFSKYNAPFDEAMNGRSMLTASAREGFNIFMSKAQCGTCHFVPQFNGVKPPFIGSEFEVLGVPADTAYTALSADKGRYGVNPAVETDHAFRTGTIRNATHTMPYMHNGVFRSLSQVIDFYNTGGGAGHGLNVPNQTLAADSLHLTANEKEKLLLFIASLDEQLPSEQAPRTLPVSSIKALNTRKSGGIY
jgi:cytochrome c peroxidase